MQTVIIINRCDGKSSRHYSHAVAAKELAKSRKAQVTAVIVRERSGNMYTLSAATMDQEINPRIAKRDVSGLIEIMEIVSF